MIGITLALGLLAGAFFIIRWWWYEDDLGFGIFLALIELVIGTFMAALILTGIASAFPVIVTESHPLRALANGQSETGHFFLGSGTINEEPVFNFVEDHGNYSTLEHVNADSSRVYQDEAEHPRVAHLESYAVAWWLAPFPVTGFQSIYEFHVPAGSVDNSYSVKP